MKLNKVYIILVLAIFVSILLIAFNSIVKSFINSHAEILEHIKEAETNNQKLRADILKSSYFLYFDYSNIYDDVLQLERTIEHLKQNHTGILGKIFPKTHKKLEDLQKHLKAEKEKIYDFEVINSIIKNTQTYIPTLAIKYLSIMDNKKDIHYFTVVMDTVSKVFLIKNSFDETFLEDVQKNIKVLEIYSNFLNTPKEKEFNKVFIRHLKVFVENYPEYKNILTHLLKNTQTQYYLEDLRETFIDESKQKAKLISLISSIINLVFFAVLGYLAFLMLKLDKQNITLKILKKSLEESLYTDELTGLPNRFAFNKDIDDYFKSPTFILINIDGFKHINDIYGNFVGDEVLKSIAKTLHSICDKFTTVSRIRVYRLGSDDFGILIDSKLDFAKLVAEDIANQIENNEIKLDTGLEVSINISIGISCEKPLFEKADLALKVAKTSREKIIIYSKNLKVEQEFKKNISLISKLRTSIKTGKLKVYYQPILDNKSNKIAKYEALIRIFDENNNPLPTFEVIEVAKKTKYYRFITEFVLKDAMELSRYIPDVEISVNFSYEDLIDEKINEIIFIEGCRKVNLVFEILESESIKDYELILEFSEKLKRCNMKIAIDDFGSGYSNFVYLSKLKSDYIKIDGSLIKNIHKDENLKEIVSTINTFAHKLGIKTVAEFVHCEEVFQVVKQIGIDYSQGFYIGKPEELKKPLP